MKNFLLFGTITVFTFLACLAFLSRPELFKNAAAVGYQTDFNRETNLTSSVSYLPQPVATERSSLDYSIFSDLPIESQVHQSVLTVNETVQISEPDRSDAGKKFGLRKNGSSLLSAPTVDIDGWQNEIEDSSTIQLMNATEPSTSSASQPVAIISKKQENGYDYTPRSVLDAYIKGLISFAKEHEYSDEVAFLVNLGMKSGKKRFYVINLKEGSIISRGLVAHGQGKKQFTLNREYSNQPGSKCSSLGLYRVGGAYTGSYGKSFRLSGLERSNSNALQRAIVLHAMNCIPDQEIDYPICQSEGCPSLSPKFLGEVTAIIKASKKPILLWVFDPSVESPEL